MTARNLSFPSTNGRPMKAYLAEPDDVDSPAPAVLVISELFGLNDDIRRIARRFTDSGYVAFAPDLHDTGGPRLYCIAKTMRSLRRGKGGAFDDLEAARTWLSERDAVDGDRVGVAGFCMGGGFALLYAGQAPLRAAATFYGIVPKEQAALEEVCPILAGYGALDRQLAGMPDRLRGHLDTLGVAHDVQVYDGAGHSYMSQHGGILGKITDIWPMSGMHVGYDEAAAEDSWRRMIAFFDTHVVKATSP
ncbi:MAG TPA: dienelactone hydrolase family protein [Dehalococcoidia bacterium]|nr:dienelactone hydrolase family protein [Dehalococcoidia bacterium]